MKSKDEIVIKGAKVHNLKNIDVTIPKNTLTVITGPSGSGKSSLAFDTIYVEGQRRYIESLSSYARQFLGQYPPPDVESITGLSPAVAIDQNTSSKNPRSTVGTLTEIYDYLRVLYSRAGTLYSPKSGKEIRKYTPAQIVRELLNFSDKTKMQIMAPVLRDYKGDVKLHLSRFLALGFSRIRLNGEMITLDDNLKTKKGTLYNIDVVIDRIIIKEEIEKRLTDSVEQALKLGQGRIGIIINDKEELSYSENNMAEGESEIYPDLEPRLFSFNSPIGACSVCKGIGESKIFTKESMIFDKNLSIPQGALKCLNAKSSFLMQMVKDMAKAEKVDLDKPFHKLPSSFVDILFNGSEKKYQFKFETDNYGHTFNKTFPGILNHYEKRYVESTSDKVRQDMENFMEIKVCPKCHGKRLNEIALATLVSGKNIMDISDLSIDKALLFFETMELEGEKKIIAQKILVEIKSRLKFLLDVGLSYLNLNRSAATLSGGEAQRIRLATQIGSSLSGVLYVLDEPSIGLHQKDNIKLIKTMKQLRDLNNTIIVVEHDEETMLCADYVLDMGPGAGEHGGEVVAQGSPQDIMNNSKSLTGDYLCGRNKIDVPKSRKKLSHFIKISGATKNNLKNLTVEIPLEGVVCITGVSGSGKSTLVHEVLVPAVKVHLKKSQEESSHTGSYYQSITGTNLIKQVIELDQSPIGRTPHSNPATYSGLFDEIRTLYSKTPDSQMRGYKPGRFSFNLKGGRCEECEGHGVKKIEMHFLPDVYITCSTCNGTRYNSETLAITYKGKNIAEVLDMSIEEGLKFFQNYPRPKRILQTMVDVGLGYMKLGQPATTLSGGEAQRLKLSRELSKKTKGHCLYVLDEPTTGLHFQDIKILLKAIHTLVEQNNSMIIIEHNLDVIKTADYIIDLGPEGGDQGGEIVSSGTPEQIIESNKSHTATFLKKYLL